MNRRAQQRAIAEACGWHDIVESGRLDGQLVGRHPDNPLSLMINVKGAEIPNYTDSLDVMQEAENHIPRSKYDLYCFWIHDLTGARLQSCMTPAQEFTVIHASAMQKAEAFLRALDLWHDSPRKG